MRAFLKGWSLIHTLKAKSYTCIKHWKNSTPETVQGGCHLYVFVPIYSEHPVPPPLNYTLEDKELTLTFQGRISGAKCIIGLDTFAGGPGYIHPDFVKANGLQTRDVQANITLGDSTIAPCTKECLVHIQLGSFSSKAWLLVMGIPEPYKVLLGDAWCKHHKVNISYSKQCIEITTPSRKHTVKALNPEPIPQYHAVPNRTQDPIPPQPTLNPIPLTFMQVQEYSKLQYPTYLVMLQPELELQDSLETEPSPQPDPTISAEIQTAVDKILADYKEIFGDKLYQTAEPLPFMPELIPIIQDSKPANRPMYRYAPAEIDEIKKQVTAMLEQGIVEHSTSPYGAPVLLVKKPDGSWRFCVDYRALNQITIKNSHPLPRIDDLLDTIQGAKYFSSMDLLQGFYQLPILQSDKEKTAFKTPFGLYQFRVVSMGLSNAPSVFQRVMNYIFKDYIGKFVAIYLDDILIYSKTQEEHLEHLKLVLAKVQEYGLSLKTNKCHFFKQQVKFLGFIVTKEGIKPNPEKVQAVKDWPVPQTQSHIRSFLALTQFFRRFIKDYSSIAWPLTERTKDTYIQNIQWDNECQAAFEELKRLLCEAPILQVPDFTKPFTMVTDASVVGMGGVLFQDDQTVAYESKKFSPTEANYQTTERELLSLVYCLKKWAVYMRHNPDNVIYTDHIPNTYFKTKPTLSPKEIRWMELINQFPGQIKYKPGKENIVADALSRAPSFYLATLHRGTDLAQPSPDIIQPLEAAELLALIQRAYTQDPSFNPSEYTLRGQLYYLGDKIYVPNALDARTHVIYQCHNALTAGHLGRDKTLHLVNRLFFWPNITGTVEEYVNSCQVCQITKPRPGPQVGPLTLPADSEIPWSNISLDLITDLPATIRYDSIITVVDRCTKMVVLIPCNKTVNAPEFAQLMVDHVFNKLGWPTDILTDRDRRFTGFFWSACCHLWKINPNRSTAFHPQSDGQTERVNRAVEQILRAHTTEFSTSWDRTLSSVEFAINNSIHASLLQTPFFLNFGRHPHTPLMAELHKDTLPLLTQPEAAALRKDKDKCLAAGQFTTAHQEALQFARTQVIKARDRYKSYADKHRIDVSYQVGDNVLLSTENLNKHSQSKKLYPKYLGPFKVLKKVNDVAYKLDLPSHMTIHPVFHVNLIKPYIPGKTPMPPQPPLPELIDGHLEWEVYRILGDRSIPYQSGSKGMGKAKQSQKTEFLVHWAGYPVEEATWEPASHLKNAQDAVDAYYREKSANEARFRTRKRT
jgi:hypothetical protein